MISRVTVTFNYVLPSVAVSRLNVRVGDVTVTAVVRAGRRRHTRGRRHVFAPTAQGAGAALALAQRRRLLVCDRAATEPRTEAGVYRRRRAGRQVSRL